MLFHFQNKEAEKFLELIENNLKLVHPRFQAAFQTFLKNKEPKKGEYQYGSLQNMTFHQPTRVDKDSQNISRRMGDSNPRASYPT